MKSRTVQSRRIALPIAGLLAAALAAGAWAATSTPLSTGPNEAAADSSPPTPSELAKVKAMHATAAIALHYAD